MQYNKGKERSKEVLFMEFRTEHDSMGEIQVPAAQKWGAQTQRSLENFKIGEEVMPAEIIEAFALLKKACHPRANGRIVACQFLSIPFRLTSLKYFNDPLAGFFLCAKLILDSILPPHR
jgi:hypothetical protein